MSFLCFLVVGTVGVLRPLRYSFALDGLADTEFYKTYFVSAFVVLFAPIYTRLANRFPWKTLVPGVAFFFAGSFLVFRLLYVEGSAVFGMAFYGWYDLFAAACVTQFYIATQIFFNAREAKRAYPFVIAGGSIGATVGGSLVGVYSERIGTPNFLPIASVILVAFAIAMMLAWAREAPEEEEAREPEGERLAVGDFRRIFSNSHVRLIASAVLITVLVKQMVDYSFATAVELNTGERDAMSEFFGFFMAATQWTPIIVLVALRPLLGRWGIAIALFMFPAVMLGLNAAVAVAWGLWPAVIAKGADSTFRYSAERTGREILYVPVPDEIKLKAKAWIDVAVEKGVGKGGSALMLVVLVPILGYRMVPFAAVALAALGLYVASRVRREYVKSLAQSIEGRFASFRGTYVSIAGPDSLRLVREALTSDRGIKVAFALDLLDGADDADLERLAPELHGLLKHASPEIRARALAALARIPEAVELEAVRARLGDPDGGVREAAVAALAAASSQSPGELCAELLGSPDAGVRSATLACLARSIPAEMADEIIRPFYERRRAEAGEDPAARLELAHAAGLVRDDPEVVPLLEALCDDSDPQVACAALGSAGRLARPELVPILIRALGRGATRGAAREALEERGEAVLGDLIAALENPAGDPRVRRSIPAVLAGIPAQSTVDALIAAYLNPDTEQLLDDRALKALNKLRSRHPELEFDEALVMRGLERELLSTASYLTAFAVAKGLDGEHPSVALLARTLREAQAERRESLFRWLGLVYPPEEIYRCYLAVTGGDQRARANAIEWLETTVGHALYKQLRPALRRAPEVESPAGGPEAVLRALWDEEDVWIARCALWTMADLGNPSTLEELARFQPGDPGLGEAVARVRARLDGDDADAPASMGDGMDLIEKVFLLQNVDLLSGARSGQLALLASIGRVVDAEDGEVLVRRGEPPDALYVVIRGEVELKGAERTLQATEGSAFGTWALIDEDPSLVEATAVEPAKLLKIRRGDFRDLLADNPELGLGLLQGLAKRVRTLAGS